MIIEEINIGYVALVEPKNNLQLPETKTDQKPASPYFSLNKSTAPSVVLKDPTGSR